MKQNLTKIKAVVAIVATTIILASCSSKYEKAPSGLTYKITHGSGKEKIKQGQVIKFYIEYKLAGKDTILNSNYGKMPGYMPVDTARLPKYNFTEIITKLAVGDKVDFVLYLDTLKRLGQIPAYDNLFKKGGSIKGKVEIIKVFASDSLAQADYQEEVKKEEIRSKPEKEKKEKEMKEKAATELKEYLNKNKADIEKQTASLKEYATKNNIKTVQSALGVLVEIATEGTGEKPTDGSHAKVMYRGYLMDGKVFDANMGVDARSKEPIDVVFGRGGVIPGFEDGLKYFNKGAKGRILIPAALAYRDQANQGIPANSNLIFDIEVTDVTAGK